MVKTYKIYIIISFISLIIGFFCNVGLNHFQTIKNNLKIQLLQNQNKELQKDVNTKDSIIKSDKEDLDKLKQTNNLSENKLKNTLSGLHNLKNEVNIEKTKTQEELIVKVKTLYNSEEISPIDVSNVKVSESLMTNIVYDAENWKVNGIILVDKCKKYDQALTQSIDVSKEKDKIIIKQDDIIKLRDDQVSKYKIIVNNKDIENSIIIKELKKEKVNGNIKLVCGTIGGGALVWLITLL